MTLHQEEIPEEFKEEKLKYYVEKFSFPRRIGTEGEKKARKLTYLEFKKLGLNPYRENFVCSLFYSISFLRIVLLSIIFFVFSLQIVLFFDPRLNLFVIVIFTFWAIYLMRMAQKPQKINWGKNYYSENIYVFIPALIFKIKINSFIQKSNLNENDKKGILNNDEFEYDDKKLDSEDLFKEYNDREDIIGNIVISAHTDSKSQSIPTIIRVKLFKYSFMIIGILFILVLFSIFIALIGPKTWNWVKNLFEIVTILLTTIIIVFTIILFFNRSLNKSMGSLDNATGMAAVFALTDYFRDKPLKRFNLYLCQFGVEEFGQQGSRLFVLNRLRNFKRGRTFNINLDMVGCVDDDKVPFMESIGFLKKPVDPLMTKYIKDCSKKLNIEVEGFNLPTGAHTDRMAFSKYGLNGIDFVSYRAGYYTHSTEDNLEKVNYKIIQQTLRIIICMLQQMDNDLEQNNFPKIKNPKHLRHAFY